MKKIKGIAASWGKVRGRVRIICDLKDVSKMNRGEILVAEYTNPLFTSAILKASAVITDTGGKLCHGAIVARELGIPAVVGTHKATKVLENGIEVRVDGKTGIIYYE